MKHWTTLLLGTFLLLGMSYEGSTPGITKDELLGKLDPRSHDDFTEVKTKYASRAGLFLRKEVYKAFRQMWRAARKDGVDLTIVSAFRSYDYQRGIWLRKWKASSLASEERVAHIMRYSSMPGISRHHWGTDLDLNSLNNSYFEEGSGLKTYQWLLTHAQEYGFFQPYTARSSFRDSGYAMEKWHWSYHPLAGAYARVYPLLVDDQDLRGFPGAEYASSFKVIHNYVEGIETPPLFWNP